METSANDNLDETPEYKAVREKRLKIEEMVQESKGLETPETFAKFGKLQRKLVKEQKELEKMEKALPCLPAPVQKQQPDLVESINVPQVQPQPAQAPFNTQLYLAIPFYLICYVFPLCFASRFFDPSILVGTIEPFQMWPIHNWLFSEYVVNGQYHTFISFRVAYILSMKVAAILIWIIGKVVSEVQEENKQKKD